MISNLNQSPLQIYPDILTYTKRHGSPRPRTVGYHLLEESVHHVDGFRDVVEPAINTETQYRGGLVHDEQSDVVTYEVNDYTPEEIAERTKSQLLAQAQADRDTLLRIEKEKAVMDSFQAISDPAEALANQAIYPFWSGDSVDVLAGEKYQAFDDLELKLYEVIQSHTTQEGWEPPTVPALFKRVALSDEILPWVQPTGAHDAYAIGDRVSYQGYTWESTVNANIYAPGVVAGQWVVV